MTAPQTASLKQLNDLINAIVVRRDKLAVYFDDVDTVAASVKTGVNTAVTQAHAALDAFNSSVQAL